MLRFNEPALQVYLDARWQYVFASAHNRRHPATTAIRQKALHGRDLAWFQNEYGHLLFGVEKSSHVRGKAKPENAGRFMSHENYERQVVSIRNNPALSLGQRWAALDKLWEEYTKAWYQPNPGLDSTNVKSGVTTRRRPKPRSSRAGTKPRLSR